MAKGVFVGVSGARRKVKEIYIGVSGVRRRVKEAYVGVNGVPRKIFPSTIPAGQVVFTSSQTWTVPEGVRVVDIFCVGGGSSGQNGNGGSGWTSSGQGGGGGRTKTVKGQLVTPGQSIAVVVGAGGAQPDKTLGATHKRGGNSSFGSLVTAEGSYADWNSAIGSFDGGSGGGGLGTTNPSFSEGPYNGGSNGSNGGFGSNVTGGKGQGTTTRAFGEASGTLYAGGGGGGLISSGYGLGGAGGGGNGWNGWISNTIGHGTPNTGGGGGGAGGYSTDQAGTGGSGIVIVRWAEH